ncbi:hypothetical protein ACFVUS_31205 [Nocardia sp. NPDC058058]|uniref:hypothetical protein n=1 Tax=Nocardia sp. NPDC058058 TaxID=3346317 RepID=UPI0036DC0022
MWPFTDEQSFWAWAADPDAVLMEQDEDLLLHDPAGLPLLLDAAGDANCPKRSYCAAVLCDYSRRVVGWRVAQEYSALQAAATRASDSRDGWVRWWSEYVSRLFSYVTDARPVNRAEAERMATDLLTCPANNLVIQIAPGEKHWQCAESGNCPTYLYINRRTGDYRMSRQHPLSREELRTLYEQRS